MVELRSQATRNGSDGMRSLRKRPSSVSRIARLALSVCLFDLTGCGAAAYSYNVVRATRSVEQARQVGAEKRAPYEWTLAQAYLAKAREESAEASYQDAVRFAKLSRSIADRAADRSRSAAKKASR